jgi:hypothetical protein
MGSISVERVTQDVLTGIDSVDFYITSKKVFLQGARKNTSIPLNKVMQFTRESPKVRRRLSVDGQREATGVEGRSVSRQSD